MLFKLNPAVTELFEMYQDRMISKEDLIVMSDILGLFGHIGTLPTWYRA